MKLILLFLAIATISHCIPVAAPNNFLGTAPEATPKLVQVYDGTFHDPNDYFDINPAQISDKPDVQNALSFGISKILNEALAARKISVTDFNITQIKRIQKQITGSGDNHKFEVVLTNSGPNGNTTINAALTVNTITRTQVRTLTSYSYQVQTQTITRPPEPTGAFTLVSPADAQSNTNIQTSLNYGLRKVLEQVRSEGRLNVDTLGAPNTKSVEQQSAGNTTFYRFNVELVNTQINFTTTFIVAFDINTQQPTIRSLVYKAESVQQTSTVTTDAQGYTPIPVIDVASDAAANDCLEYGVSQILLRAIGDRQASVALYTLTEITDAAKQMVGQTTYYRFNVELGNGQGGVIRASFTVKYNTATTNKELAAFNYQSQNTRTSTRSTTTTTTTSS